MPYKPSDLEEAGPDQPHLALLMDQSGARLAIRPGSSLWLVEDKSDASKIYPLVLKKVSVGKLVFQLGDVDYEYKLTTAKPKSKAAYQKLLANRGQKPVVVQK